MSTTMREAERDIGRGFVPAVLLSVVLNPLNSATISVGLTVLLGALHATSAGITWIVSGYYLGSAVSQPIMGSLGDRLGYRRFVVAGFALVLLTAVLAPLSQDLWVFVGWRVVQAIGTSMVYPNAVGLVRRWRAQQLPIILGWIGMAAGMALAVGPALGGLLINRFGWQAVFWLNIPIAVAAGVLMMASVPADPEAHRQMSSQRTGDWGGSLLFAGAMVFLLLFSTRTAGFGTWGLLAVGLAMLAALILWERRQRQPVIPVAWFRDARFAAVALVTILSNLVMYLALYGVPVLLETRRHLSVSASGFMLLIFAGVLALASPLGGRMARGSLRRIPYAGSALVLVAGGVLLWMTDAHSLLLVGIALALMGLSFAVSNVVLQQLVLEMRLPGESGSASGLYSLMRYVGTMASSVVIAWAFRGEGHMGILYGGMVGAGLVSLLLAVGVPRRQPVSGEGVA